VLFLTNEGSAACTDCLAGRMPSLRVGVLNLLSRSSFTDTSAKSRCFDVAPQLGVRYWRSHRHAGAVRRPPHRLPGLAEGFLPTSSPRLLSWQAPGEEISLALPEPFVDQNHQRATLFQPAPRTRVGPLDILEYHHGCRWKTMIAAHRPLASDLEHWLAKQTPPDLLPQVERRSPEPPVLSGLRARRACP